MFIQFAGFTLGKSVSAYSTPWNSFPGNISSFLFGGHDTTTGVINIQYLALFGNGVSGTIGLDDPVVNGRTSVYNLSLPLNATFNTSNAYAGVHAPDIVGNIRVDQTSVSPSCPPRRMKSAAATMCSIPRQSPPALSVPQVELRPVFLKYRVTPAPNGAAR